jgi:hypothetical protein
MARYFFHIRDGDRIIQDVEGAELPDFAAAKVEATQCARSISAAICASDGRQNGTYQSAVTPGVTRTGNSLPEPSSSDYPNRLTKIK